MGVARVLMFNLVPVTDQKLDSFDEEPKAQGGFPVNCPECGRFAKYLGGHAYYNGNFDCYSFETECKKCGICTTECV